MKQNIHRFIVSFLSAVFFHASANAATIQILHTNDLHSQMDALKLERRFDQPISRELFLPAGYAAVKGMFDKLKTEAAAQGVSTITLDAGDFTEGSPMFLANKGEDAWKVMSAMGYDAVTIGNHDWLAGGDYLERMTSTAPSGFAFLGANVHCDANKHASFTKALLPYKILNLNGTRVGIIGVTTRSKAFIWRADTCDFSSPAKAIKQSIESIKDKTDFIIVLSHLGTLPDKKIAKTVRGIDLIVGGHWHQALEKPIMVKNLHGRVVPIVQAGDRTQYVGQIRFEVLENQAPKLIDYNLIHLTEDGPSSPVIKQLVDETRAHLEARYGQDWLYESIGTSETPLQAVKTDWPGSAWSGLVTNSLRRAVNADIGIDFAEFNGKAVFLPGVITREHIMTLYPRTFDVTDPMGWRVWKGKATGAMIELAVRSSLLFRYGLFFSGITFEPGKNKIYINGKLLRKYKTYTLAMPEGIAKGSQEMHALLKLIIHGAEPTEIPMWTAIENEIKLNSPIREKTF